MTRKHNPDHYKKGVRVIASAKAVRQGIGCGMVGTVVSPYPRYQIVTIKWDYKRSTERWHVDMLEVVK